MREYHPRDVCRHEPATDREAVIAGRIVTTFARPAMATRAVFRWVT